MGRAGDAQGGESTWQPARIHARPFALAAAEDALEALKSGQIDGAAVLQP